MSNLQIELIDRNWYYGYGVGSMVTVHGGATGGDPNTSCIYLTAEQALDLLSWLEGQKTLLEKSMNDEGEAVV